jgi:hypothetical protein
MKIEVLLTGGLAGADRSRPRQNVPLTLDCETLPTRERAELTRLLERAAQAPPPPERVLPDAATYRITVHGGGGVRSLSATPGNLSPELSDLLAWLMPRLSR